MAQLVPLNGEGRPTMGSVTLVADEDQAYFSTGDAWIAEANSD